MSKTKYNILSG